MKAIPKAPESVAIFNDAATSQEALKHLSEDTEPQNFTV